MDITTGLTREQLLNAQRLDFARLVSAKHFSKRESIPIAEYFARTFPRAMHRASIAHHFEKSAVPAASSISWGSALVHTDPPDLVGAVIAGAAAVVPRLGLRRVPFLTPALLGTAGAGSTTYWQRGPAATKIVVDGAVTREVLEPAVVAAITLVTEEVLRFSAPGSIEFVRDLLSELVTRGVDRGMFDPTAGPAGTGYPASLTYNVVATPATGQPRDDVQALIADYRTAGGNLDSAVLVLSAANATAWRLLDPTVFEGLSVSGGEAAGVRAVAGADDAIGDTITLVDTQRVVLADDGATRVSTHQEGSLSMTDTSVSPPAAATHTSLFQTDTIALLAERTVNWSAIGGGIAYLSRDYLSAGSPS